MKKFYLFLRATGNLKARTCQVLFIQILILGCIVLCISSCSYGVKQNLPAVTDKAIEIKVNTLSEKEIQQELEKLQKIPKEPYKIATGDRFLYKVYGQPELTTPGVIVLPGGKVSLNLVGTLKIGGLTVQEANDLINKKLSKYIKNPKAVLIPKGIKGAVFTIIGQVQKTGVYPLRSGYRINDAVALAGGFAAGEKNDDTIEMADLDHAYIVRKNKILPVDFVKSVRLGNPLNNIPLRDGDFIFIPSVMDRNIYVLGEVTEPGNIPYMEGQTLVQALSYARGKLFESAADDVFIIRGNLVKPKVFMVNSEDILQGRSPDFRLKPNDTVFVPKSSMAEFKQMALDLLPTVELINLMTGPFATTALSIPLSGGSN